MRFPPSVLPVLACLTIGTAIYVSRAVLDRVMVAERPVRVAFLPAWPAWLGFVLVAALGLWWLARVGARAGKTTTEVRRLAIGSLVLPAFALLSLTVPYWPWLPDALPATQMLAGPGRRILWLAVAAQTVWALVQAAPRGWRGLERPSIDRVAMLIAVATVALSGLAAARLTGTVLFPAGDEPHYLVIAQSLWRDGDLAIENNHQQGDYHEYFLGPDLEPHYLTRGSDGEIYSIHPVGLPLLLAPVYAAGGYRLVVALLVAMAGLAAAIMWRFVALSTSGGAATFAWAAVVGSAPFLLNTFTVYPEVAAGLATVVAFTVAAGLDRDSRPTRGLAAGVAAAALPWLSTKYAPMSAALVTVALARVWVPWPAPTTRPAVAPRVATSAAIVGPYVLSLVGWFAFFYAYWGSPWPQAPYGALVQTDIQNLVFGAPGLLFDQEYGLLAYAPVYILAVTGLVAMWRDGKGNRRRAIEVAVTVGALLAAVGAFRIWWGGSASPGRPLASGLLLLGPPIAAAFQRVRPGSASRAAQHLLLWVSAGIATTLVVARDGTLIGNGRDGSSTLLEYLSPLWEAWTLAPSFIHHEAGTAWLHSLAWLLVSVGAAVLLRRIQTKTAGGAALAALTTMGAALAIVALLMPVLPSDPAHAPLDLRARARLGGLDSYDGEARPLGIIYDPLRTVPAAELVPMLTLGVEPGSRHEPQPLRLLHNGRFSLPAGRYRVDIHWIARDPLPASGAQAIDLQVGRNGPALEQWAVVAVPGGQARAEFFLPVDAGFVGFRGSLDLERSIGALTITPLEVIDEGMRTSTPPVLAASRYAHTVVLFHDEHMFPEPSGFWTVPGRETAMTLAVQPPSGAPTVLHMHPGPRPTRVAVATYGWRQELELRPGVHSALPLPDARRRIVPILIHTTEGFVPAETDPRSDDRRRLGAWVEVGQ